MVIGIFFLGFLCGALKGSIGTVDPDETLNITEEQRAQLTQKKLELRLQQLELSKRNG